MPARPRKILVYDLGGGTFDVTVMEIGGRDFVALATDGDVHWAGGTGTSDWSTAWPRSSSASTASIRVRIRTWKGGCCGNAKMPSGPSRRGASVTLSCQYQGHIVRMEVTREQFEEMTLDLLDRTSFTTRQTLQAAGLAVADIDRILLVGGSTRMPAVQRMLKELSGKDPDRSVSPDEAVAHGAALHAGLLAGQARGTRSPVSDQECQFAQPGCGGQRSADQAGSQCDPDSPQHDAAGGGQAGVSNAEGGTAVRPGTHRRRRSRLPGPLFADRQVHDP